MSSPVCPNDWAKINFGESVCEVLTELIRTNDKLLKFFSWMLDPDTCKISPDFVREFLEVLQPVGSGFWSPVERTDTDFLQPSAVWVPARGQSLARVGTYAKLFNVFQTQFGSVDADHFNMPDLQGRFMLISGTRTLPPPTPPTPPPPSPPTYNVHDVGGEDSIDILNHKHGFGCTFPNLNGDKGTLFNQGGTDTTAWLEQTAAADNNDKFLLRTETVLTGLDAYRGTGLDAHEATNNQQGYPTIKNADLITTEAVLKTAPGPSNNMPPYMAGVYYIRANHRLNGVLL